MVPLFRRIFEVWIFSVALCMKFDMSSGYVEKDEQNYDDYDVRQVLVIAGNFSLDGEIFNMAQYDISTGM